MPSSPPVPATPSTPHSARGKRRWWRRAGWTVAILLAAGGGLLYTVLPYIAIRTVRSERWMIYHNRTPADLGLSAENLWVETEPGMWLRGWYVRTPQPAARGMVVLLHGHSSCKESELGLAKLLSAHGYDCLLYDARAHGESGGEYCTFGFYERRDLSRFLDDIEHRFGPPKAVAVFGNSMGAAVALQAMAEDPRIRCAVLESPFATMREIVHDYMQHFSGVSSFAVSNLALARAERIAHFSVDAVSPEAAARSIHQPVLISHGADDHWIAFRYGERVFRQLNAPGSVWNPVPGADHDGLWKVGGDGYKQLVLDFLDQHCR